jgi:hypothetical protein
LLLAKEGVDDWDKSVSFIVGANPRRSASSLDATMFDWLHTLGRVLWWVTSRVYAPFIAIGLPIMILYGWVVPNQADLAALGLQKHEVAMLVGAGAGGTTCSGSGDCQSVPSQRSYIVIPRVFRDAAVVSVSRTAPTSTTESVSGGALIWLAMWMACTYCTSRVYRRSRGSASNKTLASAE